MLWYRFSDYVLITTLEREMAVADVVLDGLALLEELGKKQRLNKAEIEEILVQTLSLLTSADNELERTVDLLVDLDFAIITPFTEDVLTALEHEEQARFVQAFLKAEKVASNRNHYGLRRIVLMVHSLLGEGEAEGLVHVLFKAAVKHQGAKGSNAKTDQLLAEKLPRLYELDYSSWRPAELNGLLAWLEAVAQTEKAMDGFLKFKHKWAKGDQPDKSAGQPAKKRTRKDHGLELLSQLEKHLERLNRDLAKHRAEEQKAKGELGRLNGENSDLSSRVEELNEQNRGLEGQVYRLETRLESLTRENAELNERLQAVFAADKNQIQFELDAFRGDLATRLRPDYKDFLDLADLEPHPDYYRALIVVLEGIFETLRRKGIRFPGVEG